MGKDVHDGNHGAMSRHDLFAQILASLHDTLFDDAQWPATSGLLDDACGSTGNILVFGEGQSQDDVDIFFARFCFRPHRDPARESFTITSPVSWRWSVFPVPKANAPCWFP